MKWFIVVVMTQQLNASSPETPLWIPYVHFENKESCQVYARNNQLMLFQRAIAQYKGEILPTMLSCVNQDILKQINEADISKVDKNEKDI